MCLMPGDIEARRQARRRQFTALRVEVVEAEGLPSQLVVSLKRPTPFVTVTYGPSTVCAPADGRKLLLCS